MIEEDGASGNSSCKEQDNKPGWPIVGEWLEDTIMTDDSMYVY